MPTSTPEPTQNFKPFAPLDKKPQTDLITSINFYLLPLISIVVSVLLMIFQILPTISDINTKTNELNSKVIQNNSLANSITKTSEFYSKNADNINLSLELLNKVAPIEQGQLSESKTLVETITTANSLKLTGFRSSENLRDIVTATVANSLLANSKHRVAISELVTDGTLVGSIAMINNLFKSGKLYVIESLDLQSDSDVATNVKSWNTRVVLAKYWFSEDFMKSQTKESLIGSASNSLDLDAIAHLKSKVAK